MSLSDVGVLRLVLGTLGDVGVLGATYVTRCLRCP